MMLLGLAVLIVIGALICWCIYTFNVFQNRQYMIDFWWDETDAHLQLRRDLIPSLLDRARPIMASCIQTMDRIAAIREEIIGETIKTNSLILSRELEQMENKLSLEMRSLQDAFRSHKDAQMNPGLLTVMSELVSIEGKAIMACEEYNKLTGVYNASINSFPANLVVKLLHFNPLEKRIFGDKDETLA